MTGKNAKQFLKLWEEGWWSGSFVWKTTCPGWSEPRGDHREKAAGEVAPSRETMRSELGGPSGGKSQRRLIVPGRNVGFNRKGSPQSKFWTSPTLARNSSHWLAFFSFFKITPSIPHYQGQTTPLGFSEPSRGWMFPWGTRLREGEPDLGKGPHLCSPLG